MADVGKTKISVERKINPFGETKTKKPPDWFRARPGAESAVTDLTFKRTMELDPRKWKKKVIEDGIYAVARYELSLFATVLGTLEKDILNARPKERKKAKFQRNDKDETPDEKKALDDAEAQVKKLFKKISGQIEDKVSVALDEVESDKGDNKNALAAGKEALKKFDTLDTSGMFSKLTSQVVKAVYTLGVEIEKSGDEAAQGAFKKSAATLDKVRKEYDGTAKSTKEVANFLLTKGAKMATDTKADPALQDIGKMISKSGKVNASLVKLSGTIDTYEKALDETIAFVKGGKSTGSAAKNWATRFGNEHKNKDKAVADAVKSVKIVSKKFNEAARKVK